MNLLSTNSALSYCQSFELSNYAELPTAVSQLLHEIVKNIKDLSLDDEDIALFNRAIENYLIDVENAYTGHIIDLSYVNSGVYNQDIDKLVNHHTPLIPSDILLVFALNKLVNVLDSGAINDLWLAFGEASQAFALAKISTAVSDTILLHEEFLDQVPNDLLEEWQKLKKSNSSGGSTSSKNKAIEQEKLFSRAKKIAPHIWPKHSEISPNKMAELIKAHFEEAYGHKLKPDTVPKVAKLSVAIRSIAPNSAPKRVNKKQTDYIFEQGAIIAKQIAEFDKA